MRLFPLFSSIAALSYCWAAQASDIRKLLQENRLEEASSECRTLEERTAADRDQYLACAWVFFRTGRLDSADGLLERVRQQTQTLPEYRLLRAFGLVQRKQYAAAREELANLRSDFKEGKIGLDIQEVNGELYEAQKQLDTAGFLYKQILTEDKERGRSHWGLARFHLAKNEVARAKTHFEETARLWPLHVGSRYNLAVIALSQDSFGDAAKWLGECYKLDRADPGVLEQMGLLFEKKGMISEAVKYWQRAVELGKEAPLARRKLSENGTELVDSLMKSGQWEAALAKLSANETSMKGQSEFLLKRGIIHRNLGNYEKSVTDLRAYVKKNAKNASAHRELGIAYVNLKLLDQAATHFARALENDPENGLNYAWAAFLLETKGDMEQAREVWKKATELLTDPEELKKAARKLASIEKKLTRRENARKQKADENSEDQEPEIAEDIFKQLK